MASAPSDMVYVAQDITRPTEVQYNFSNQYNMDEPETARMNYMRIMHEHTRQQFEMAAESSRRRSSTATSNGATHLRNESSAGSIASTDS